MLIASLLLLLPWNFDLRALAASSVRPPECAEGAEARSVWERARGRNLSAFCEHLARGTARLDHAPELARRAADDALALFPSAGAPLVLKARALLRLGDATGSHALFQQVASLEPRAMEPPLALHDAAEAARRAGEPARARQLYRRLVTVSAHLPAPVEEATVLLRAAHVALAVAESGTSPELEEAIGYLRRASALAVGRQRLDVVASMALVLDRAGRASQADELLRGTGGLHRWIEGTATSSFVALERDDALLRALVLARFAPDDARALFERVLSTLPNASPWRAGIEAHVERLRKNAPKRRGSR